jgi:lipopolysaccharide/colanic/teichoic acid biosynthesis glycosyltransferase
MDQHELLMIEPTHQQRPRIQSSNGRAHPRLDDILPKHHFFKQLEREKRRTDRSKAPLSIALFHLDSKKSGEPSAIDSLLNLLRSGKRETDIVGYLGAGAVALCLPDTTSQGTQGFIQKIVSRANDLHFSTVAGTYPDRLFDNLIAEDADLPDFHLFLDDPEDRHERGYFLKRSIDVIGSIVGMLLLWPLLLITAVAIAVTTPGPVIFKQTRLGRRGVPFVFYKFRSMSRSVDDRIHREYVTSLIKGNLEKINQGDTAKPLYKIKSDPRITRVGRIIRKTSIDELPQLFNVLKGDMSLVGPRPPIPYEAEKYQSWHLRRILEIKPGLTGLWQVEGRSKTSFDDMVRLDLRYIRDCSLMLDLKIMIKTVKVVLRCDGAT